MSLLIVQLYVCLTLNVPASTGVTLNDVHTCGPGVRTSWAVGTLEVMAPLGHRVPSADPPGVDVGGRGGRATNKSSAMTAYDCNKCMHK